MLSVFICEDELNQREYMESIVSKHVAAESCNIELVLSTGVPTDILDYLKKYPHKNGLYFLDVDLQHQMNGIDLAAEIRDIDFSAKIVFVTTHAELSYLVFTHKVEAMDYIVKNRPESVEKRVLECIFVAYKRYLNDKVSSRKRYQVKAGGQVWNIPFDEILFFETNPAIPHKIILHMEDNQIEFRGSVSDVAKVSPDFYRCHKSFVVNTKNIQRIDKPKREVEMINGEIVPATIRKIPELVKILS